MTHLPLAYPAPLLCDLAPNGTKVLLVAIVFGSIVVSIAIAAWIYMRKK